MSNTANLLHGCDTICCPLLPSNLRRTELNSLKLNICSNESTMNQDMINPTPDSGEHEHSMDERSNSGAQSNDTSFCQTSSREDAEVTMCICPVCGFSASSPRGQDEHMETEHGDCYAANAGADVASTRFKPSHQVDRTSPVSGLRSPDGFSSSTYGLRASSTPQQTRSVHDPAELGASLTASTTRFSLPHTASLPHFPYEFPISQSKCNPNTDATSVASSGKISLIPTEEISRAGTKTRTYRGSLCRNLRVGSASKLTAYESNVEGSLFLQKVDSRRRYRCNICPATFPWHGDLTEHLRLAHGMQKTRESARSGKAGSFCCNHCKYVAKYQSELRRHMRLHWGVKPFVCVFCPYRSAWKGDLKRHMESHHRERFSSEAELIEVMSQFKNNAGTTVNGLPLTTKSVGDTYNFGSDFESETADDVSCQMAESHELSSGEVSLSSIPKPSSRQDLLGFRSSAAQPDKTDAQLEHSLICTICSYKAQNQSKLHNHMAGHMNLKPFKCPMCEHRSNYKWDVRKHLRSQHPEHANVPVVVLSGAHTTTANATPPNLSPPDSPLSLRIDAPPQKSPEGSVTIPNTVHLPSTSLTSQSPRWPIQQTGLCESSADVVPIDLSVGVKDTVIAAHHNSNGTPVSKFGCLSAPSESVASETLVHHTISTLVDHSLSTNPCMSSNALSETVLKTTTNPGSLLSFAPPATALPWTPKMGMDQAGLMQSGNPSTIGLLFNLQQQLLMNGLLNSWSARPFSAVVSSPSTLPLQLPTTNPESDTVNLATTSVNHANGIELSVPSRLAVTEFHRTVDTGGLHGKAPSEWSSTDTDLSDLSQAVRSTISIDSPGHRDPQRRARGRKSGPACYGRSTGSLGSKEEQWKRHQCSGCGHRSNWKWDINKHIKVAHPERTNITTVTLDLEEAKNTFGEYMNRLKLSRTRYLHDGAGAGGPPSASGVAWASNFPAVGEGYYRPYKCSVCGHRSNWKWDVRKHIKQMHNSQAEVITLSLDEARRTIHQYKSCRRQQTRHPEPVFKVETRDDNSMELPAQSTNGKENTGSSPALTHWSAIEDVKSDELNPETTDIVVIDHEANRLQTTNSPNVLKERSCKLYYSCRQCGRRFRSYQTLFFHLHHRHHIASAENKSSVSPRISIGFYYAVSRCYTRSAAFSNSHQLKVLRNFPCTTTDPTEQLDVKELHVSEIQNTVPKSEDIRSEIVSSLEPNNLSPQSIGDQPQFIGRNLTQRDRLLRGRRRTCVPVTQLTKSVNFSTQGSLSSEPFPRPLSSHDNASSNHRPVSEEHKTPCDISSRTVKQLSDLLDKVLFILEEKVSGQDGPTDAKHSLTEQASCPVTSHLADLIEETVSKNENIHFEASRLDSSSSSNEENRPLVGAKQKALTRPLDKLLNHPEVEQRFLRLAKLLHTHGDEDIGNRGGPCKRPRTNEHTFHEPR